MRQIALAGRSRLRGTDRTATIHLMGKRTEKAGPASARVPSDWADTTAKSDNPPVRSSEYATLASVLERKDSAERVLKKDPHGETLRAAGELYANREYVAAYEAFRPVYDKLGADLERILTRNVEFEANKLASKQRMPLAMAKSKIEGLRAHSQQILDELTRLLRDLEAKPLVRLHLKTRSSAVSTTPPPDESTPPTPHSPSEPSSVAEIAPPSEIVSGDKHYRTAPFSPPEVGTVYSVRDKTGGQRVIRVTATDPAQALVHVETLEAHTPSHHSVKLSIDSLVRQAKRGWCFVLAPIAVEEQTNEPASALPASQLTTNTVMRLDIQNFGRCCADIARANIRFSTQLIKDVGDGPFRAGDYEHAFISFEQLAVGFNSAVAASRREIADGRRTLTAEKGHLSGREIQDRSAAFTRREQLVHTAEREFSTILEGLRMFLTAQRANSGNAPEAGADLSRQTH